MRRRLLLKSGGGGGIDPSEATALDVVFYNSSIDDLVIRKQEDWQDGETPIGIVVVPASHNRYGDGTCGVMSLVTMNCNYPESGHPTETPSATTYIYWGYNGLIGNQMTNLSQIYCSISQNYTIYIPFQSQSTYTRDLVSFNTGSTYCFTEFPYKLDTYYESTNLYSVKDDTPNGDFPSFFKGISDTAAIYVATKSNAQWTANTVTNSTSSTNTPAAACCGRFKTLGTKSFLDVYSGITSNSTTFGTADDTYDYKKMWYMPGIGETCYTSRWFYTIQETLKALNNKYGNVCITRFDILPATGEQLAYISGHQAYFCGIGGNGHFAGQNKSNSFYNTRAFMRL